MGYVADMTTIDEADIVNALIDFNEEYRFSFRPGQYTSIKRTEEIINKYKDIFASLTDGSSKIEEVKLCFTDPQLVSSFLEKYQNIESDAERHNEEFVEAELIDKKEYLDTILKELNPKIMLDDEQRRAVVVDDDYCLLIAGAGSGKTTTVAAKVKYLVEKKKIDPKKILVLSFTREAVKELGERINSKLGIKANVSTFHSLGFNMVGNSRDEYPEVISRPSIIIQKSIENMVNSDKKLLEELVHYFGYYFDLNADVFKFDSLEKYHEAKAAQDYETLKSVMDRHIQNIEEERMKKNMRSLKGEYLNSDQEVQIANFLYLNSIEYVYEMKYERGIASKHDRKHLSSIKGSKKEYTPDFYIIQGGKRAYLEHYSLAEDGTSDRYDGAERMRYEKSIKDKQNHHKQWKTTLLETWSKYNDGRPLLDHLGETLIKNKFILKERDHKEVYEKIVETGKDKYTSKFTEFMTRFIELYKTTRYDAGFDILRKEATEERTIKFLDIAEKVFAEYTKILREENKIDFADMIIQAAEYLDEIKKRKIPLGYKYIIVDEYQDINRQRFDLVKKLSQVTDAKIIAVGDDWQSIYAFAGSDVTLFTDFHEKMGGHGIELNISRTYRNSQELIDVAGNFIQKNTSQKRKRLKSDKHLERPIVIREYDDEKKNSLNNRGKATEEAIGEIIKEYGDSTSILLLGRYGFDGHNLSERTKFFREYRKGKMSSTKFKETKMEFMTVHKSKGLESDNVIILNMSEGKYGFPSQMKDDTIFELVMPEEEKNIQFAEERRLFYVALTRTSNKVYIIAPIRKPSRFLKELKNDFAEYIDLPGESNIDPEEIDSDIRCPECGYPLKRKHIEAYDWTLYACTNDPEICDYKASDKNLLRDIFKCSLCEANFEDGYMIIKRNGENDIPFYGCTNYRRTDGNKRKCKHTLRLDEGDIELQQIKEEKLRYNKNI